MKSQIVFNRVFSHTSKCPFCGSMVFHFIEEVLMFDGLTKEAEEEINEAFIDGESFEDIETQNPIPRESFEVWECATCDHKGDSPTKANA